MPQASISRTGSCSCHCPLSHSQPLNQKEIDAFLLLSRSFIERSPGSTDDSTNFSSKMATHSRKDDFCLACHWESFHLGGKSSEDSSGSPAPSWDDCPDKDHHASDAHCNVGTTCCDTDNCSITCPSVCDGFVECHDSPDCSVSRCEEPDCYDPAPVCFDEHCFNTEHNPEAAEHPLDSLFGLGIPMASDKNDFTVALEQCQADHQLSKAAEYAAAELTPSLCTGPFFTSDSIALTPCHPHGYHPDPHATELSHFQQMEPQPLLPLQNEVDSPDVFHMLGMCPDFSNHFHVHEAANCPETLDGSTTSDSFACLHLDEDSISNLLKNHNYMNSSLPTRGPCRSNHRCRSHHAHVHPYSPYSRHSRSSFSSQMLPSPGETPPPLDGGASSVITSPDFSPSEGDLHVCKWVTSSRGVKASCGATFSSACALQEHLISRHMGPVNGAKGTGYYCCWEGCSRPGVPFSQKSKLQGHFLTHSNYKNFHCTVCGKFFARQATLERHERSHRGEKPYKCSECGKSFTDSSELKTHSRTHTGEKPFKCTFPGCNFQTGDSSNMSSHRLTHGERRHKCNFPGCNKSFTRPDQLKRHTRSTHKTEHQPSTPSLLGSPPDDHLAFPVQAQLPFGAVV
ncbi:C2H2-type zinc finger protein [Aspergillus lucknowensis]|uniref:C2H2-type domain-containing protein n=1 Tax=Aspergillus lucknowensis TaxID=176173 RepID=A0ABR4M687_9EURO